jgi:hypothetical protein
MEHKRILGGAEYLSFARARVRALRATGLRYASQKFSAGDAQIYVQLLGDDEYIYIEGGEPEILSGVVMLEGFGWVNLPPPAGSPIGTPDISATRSYFPTVQAFEYPLKKKGASDRRDEPRLIGGYGGYLRAAYHELYFLDELPIKGKIPASMFSGIMAKVVQFIHGYGVLPPSSSWGTKDQKKDGVRTDYVTGFRSCNGVVKDKAGNLWLVYIDESLGVIATPLPLIPGTQKGTPGYSRLLKSKQDVLREATKLFGGLPSGEPLYTDPKLQAKLLDGRILQLATPETMAEYFALSPHSPIMGWSFNESGTEAHNTGFQVPNPDSWECYGYHVKLAFSIDPYPKGWVKGDEKPAATAIFSVVERALIPRPHTTHSTYEGDDTVDGSMRGGLMLQNEVSRVGFAWGPSKTKELRTSGYSFPMTSMSAPIFVCHHGDILDVVRVTAPAQPPATYSCSEPPQVRADDGRLTATWWGVSTPVRPGENEFRFESGAPTYQINSDRHVPAPCHRSVINSTVNEVVGEVHEYWLEDSRRVDFYGILVHPQPPPDITAGTRAYTRQILSRVFEQEDTEVGMESFRWPFGARDCYVVNTAGRRVFANWRKGDGEIVQGQIVNAHPLFGYVSPGAPYLSTSALTENWKDIVYGPFVGTPRDLSRPPGSIKLYHPLGVEEYADNSTQLDPLYPEGDTNRWREPGNTTLVVLPGDNGIINAVYPQLLVTYSVFGNKPQMVRTEPGSFWANLRCTGSLVGNRVDDRVQSVEFGKKEYYFTGYIS